jgi:replicative DNA helicase
MIQNKAEFAGQAWREPWNWHEDLWAVVEKQAEAMGKQKGIIDSESATIADVASRARLLGSKWGGLDLLVVDYLQLLRGPGDNRAQMIGGIAWGLKELAMDLGCVCLLLSQFDRTTNRDGKPPTIHGLKESGDIENASNQIILLWMADKEAGPDTVSGAHEVHLRVAKNRDGATTPWEGPGAIRLSWKKDWTKFIGANVKEF